jgi:SHS2 domain-containing protein
VKEIEQIDISGDAGLRVRAHSREELFMNAAKGMYDLITGGAEFGDSEVKEIKVTADSMENALVQWLNELIFLFDTYGFVGKVFSVAFHDTTVVATISGGTFDPQRSDKNLLIKAATYHDLSIRDMGDHWEATVIFDI